MKRWDALARWFLKEVGTCYKSIINSRLLSIQSVVFLHAKYSRTPASWILFSKPRPLILLNICMLFNKQVKKGRHSWPLNSGSHNIPQSLHHFLNPWEKEMDFRENMGILGIIAIVFEGESCYTLRLAVADKWSTGVTLQERQKDWD